MESELAQLSSTIRKAGARAKDLAHKGFEIHTKKDRSPVTTADLEVNRILREMQEMHFPDDGWLSEESPDDPARLDKEIGRASCREREEISAGAGALQQETEA